MLYYARYIPKNESLGAKLSILTDQFTPRSTQSNVTSMSLSSLLSLWQPYPLALHARGRGYALPGRDCLPTLLLGPLSPSSTTPFLLYFPVFSHPLHDIRTARRVRAGNWVYAYQRPGTTLSPLLRMIDRVAANTL